MTTLLPKRFEDFIPMDVSHLGLAGSNVLVPSGSSYGVDVSFQESNSIRNSVLKEDAHATFVAQLRAIAVQQRERIDRLQKDFAINIEHQSALHNKELTQRRAELTQVLTELRPELERVRQDWAAARASALIPRTQSAAQRLQNNSVRGRVVVLRDALAEYDRTLTIYNETSNEVTGHLNQLSEDCTTLREKIRLALQCVSVDENLFNQRIQEEEQYLTKLQQAQRAVEEDCVYAEHSMNQHYAVHQETDVLLLTERLRTMQEHSTTLFGKVIEAERDFFAAQEEWLVQNQGLHEDTERARQLMEFKSGVITYLRAHLARIGASEDIPIPNSDQLQSDTRWLAACVEVWEALLREAQTEKARLKELSQQQNKQIRSSDNAGGLDGLDTNSKRGRVGYYKLELENMCGRAFNSALAEHSQRKRQILDLMDMYTMTQDKKAVELQLMRYLQELAENLGEDINVVRSWVEGTPFDDYVSSSEDEGDEHVPAESNAVETTLQGSRKSFSMADISLEEEDFTDLRNIQSTMEVFGQRAASGIQVSPEEQQSLMDQIAHRKEGPLKLFAQNYYRFRLNRDQRPPNSAFGGAAKELVVQETDSFMRAMSKVQTFVIHEVIDHVRQQKDSEFRLGRVSHLPGSGNSGEDPSKDDAVFELPRPDPSYIAHIQEESTRIEHWKQLQMRMMAHGNAKMGKGEKGAVCSETGKALLTNFRIGDDTKDIPNYNLSMMDPNSPIPQAVDLLPEPQLMEGVNELSKALSLLSNLVQGHTFLQYGANGSGPFMREVFLTTTLTHIVWRKATQQRFSETSAASDPFGTSDHGQQYDGFPIEMWRDVVLGHATPTFQVHRKQRLLPMDEHLSFSLTYTTPTPQGNTGDMPAIDQYTSSCDLECENAQEKQFWAWAFGWILLKARGSGGSHGSIVASLLSTGRLVVLDQATGETIRQCAPITALPRATAHDPTLCTTRTMERFNSLKEIMRHEPVGPSWRKNFAVQIVRPKD